MLGKRIGDGKRKMEFFVAFRTALCYYDSNGVL